MRCVDCHLEEHGPGEACPEVDRAKHWQKMNDIELAQQQIDSAKRNLVWDPDTFEALCVARRAVDALWKRTVSTRTKTVKRRMARRAQ